MAVKDLLPDNSSPSGFTAWSEEVSKQTDDSIRKNGTVTFSAHDDQAIVDIEDDPSTPASNWADRLRISFMGRLVQWWNEFGEWRAIPSNQARVAVRIFGAPWESEWSGRNPSRPVWEIQDHRQVPSGRNSMAAFNHRGDLFLARNLTAPGTVQYAIRQTSTGGSIDARPDPSDVPDGAVTWYLFDEPGTIDGPSDVEPLDLVVNISGSSWSGTQVEVYAGGEFA